ncbi:type III pantothenate kinase [Flavobacterium pallidum]|uniref:Type III pantothenate kinase n=1 Tax=Flavobacterium pallidum TaxID=2172098 RepID=A0A2S1SGH2_9FLAO|nr:type III pantothenate kinase [Flavobacterium pallidum]AWI25452.1 type III pantothenate kinase [Flavobacterium pallidum]
MILTIDAGNTRIKGAVFEEDTMLSDFVFPMEDFKISVSKILDVHKDITDIVVASVRNMPLDDFFWFQNRVKVTLITHESIFPFRNLYETPLTLGIDRMVLSAGAVLAFPGQNRLVVDAGTCITYDFVAADDQYLGGAISPGIRLRYEALHHYTAKLPLLKRELPDHYIGKSTNQSMHSGVVNGVINEIDGFIARYEQQYPNFTIILTGGDTDFLAKQLKNTIFANSNFLLESLNHIFQYNQE